MDEFCPYRPDFFSIKGMPEVRGGRRRDTSPRTEPQTANGPPPSKRSRTATSPKPPSTRTTRGSTVTNVDGRKTGRKRDEPIKRERKNSPLVGASTKKEPNRKTKKELEESARDRRHLQREKNLQKKKEEKENIPKKSTSVKTNLPSSGEEKSEKTEDDPEDLPDLEPNPTPSDQSEVQKSEVEHEEMSSEKPEEKPKLAEKSEVEKIVVPTKIDKNPTHTKMKKLESKINELSKAKEGEMKSSSSLQSPEAVQKKKVSLKNLAAKPSSSPSSSSPSTPTPPTSRDTRTPEPSGEGVKKSAEEVKKSSGVVKESQTVETDDDMPDLEDAPVDVPMENDTPKKEKSSDAKTEAKEEPSEKKSSEKPPEDTPKTASPATKLLPESFLKSPVKKQEVKPITEVVQKTKPGAKIEEIFAKLDEKKLNEEMKKKKNEVNAGTSGFVSKPEVKTSQNESSQNAILNKILGKTPGSKPVQTSSSIRNDVLIPADDQMTSDDLSLPFESVPEVDLDAPGVGSEVTIEPGMEDEFSMTEATGTSSPGASGKIFTFYMVTGNTATLAITSGVAPSPDMTRKIS